MAKEVKEVKKVSVIGTKESKHLTTDKVYDVSIAQSKLLIDTKQAVLNNKKEK